MGARNNMDDTPPYLATPPVTQMEPFPSYVVDWELAQSERGLASFKAFLSGAGVQFELPDDLRRLLTALEPMAATARSSPREIFEERLMTSVNEALATAGDPRRLYRSVEATRRWLLLSPEETTRASAAGLTLERAGAPFRRAVWNLASVPVAIGTYLLTDHLLRERGLDPMLAWLFALGAWFLVRQVLNRTVLALG